MSQENVDLVWRLVEAFNGRDMGGLAELSHEDLEFVFDSWLVATVWEGKILRVQWFTDGVEAREAAGLRE